MSRLRTGRKGKHLRVRGENLFGLVALEFDKETPPRTRRKLRHRHYAYKFAGNTSAYAEKTNGNDAESDNDQKHLRVRGENFLVGLYLALLWETPPRTRRKRLSKIPVLNWFGNTSAYAEKTSVYRFQFAHL